MSGVSSWGRRRRRRSRVINTAGSQEHQTNVLHSLLMWAERLISPATSVCVCVWLSEVMCDAGVYNILNHHTLISNKVEKYCGCFLETRFHDRCHHFILSLHGSVAFKTPWTSADWATQAVLFACIPQTQHFNPWDVKSLTFLKVKIIERTCLSEEALFELRMSLKPPKSTFLSVVWGSWGRYDKYLKWFHLSQH